MSKLSNRLWAGAGIVAAFAGEAIVQHRRQQVNQKAGETIRNLINKDWAGAANSAAGVSEMILQNARTKENSDALLSSSLKLWNE